jgi:hypothetical protein
MVIAYIHNLGETTIITKLQIKHFPTLIIEWITLIEL